MPCLRPSPTSHRVREPPRGQRRGLRWGKAAQLRFRRKGTADLARRRLESRPRGHVGLALRVTSRTDGADRTSARTVYVIGKMPSAAMSNARSRCWFATRRSTARAVAKFPRTRSGPATTYGLSPPPKSPDQSVPSRSLATVAPIRSRPHPLIRSEAARRGSDTRVYIRQHVRRSSWSRSARRGLAGRETSTDPRPSVTSPRPSLPKVLLATATGLLRPQDPTSSGCPARAPTARSARSRCGDFQARRERSLVRLKARRAALRPHAQRVGPRGVVPSLVVVLENTTGDGSVSMPRRQRLHGRIERLTTQGVRSSSQRRRHS